MRRCLISSRFALASSRRLMRRCSSSMSSSNRSCMNVGEALRVVAGIGVLQVGVERFAHLGRALKAIVGFALERVHRDDLELVRRVFDHRRRRRHRCASDQLERLDVVLARRTGAGSVIISYRQMPTPNRSERASIWPALDHLRAHVAELLLERVDVGRLRAADGLGQAEVDQLHLAFVADDDVARRQVAMDDAGARALGVFRLCA